MILGVKSSPLNPVNPRRILYVQYTNPAAYPSLEHSSRILARHGWEILFLGTGDFIGNILRFQPHPNIRTKQLAFCPGGWRQKFHYLWFCLWVIGWTISLRPQWIYASDLLSCPIALFLSRFFALKIIYHEHDSPNGLVINQWIHLCLWTRRRLARRSEFCILPNEKRSGRFKREAGNECQTLSVLNCPACDEIFKSPPIPREGNELEVLYHGSIVPSRFPSTVLKAMSLLPNSVKLRVIGYETVGHKGYVKKLKQLAFQLGISD